MDPHTTRILISALASNARVEAMKAENQHRLATGNSVAYGEDAFLIEAGHLENLAHEIG
ncbi:hypothetical protein [Mesoterricola silvestris]|uniref:Uncharacterized protein n=1 Tax=Mesoterricola silvestris TaxID=2927979 RepID=A0AA48K8P0_9BACT|nr:hypothetical protein [Mesoterricola silvestris]BDU72320.1 hypothetical protein METEAL_14940 [Mesoterricola silvestris]